MAIVTKDKNEAARLSFAARREQEAIESNKTKRALEEKREDTRSSIAQWYVLGFLTIIAASMLIGLFKIGDVETTVDLMIGISSILSGPLGFIIGFYFKKD